MINLSIVTGTYNRLVPLRNLVDSVRRSIGKGLGYEIIVVDGGSTDGSIAWCKEQPDIKLIEQGELLGAVRAFNEGAYSARGKYVILANDDITFMYDSLIRAYAFMEDNLAVGIGCFYQDRFNRPMYVDRMSAVTEEGDRVGVYYGQVCIVPKWLGDKVGWWGDYLHTYAGDNELSCNVIQEGYEIAPMECCCIHDTVYKDQLRVINHPNGEGTHNDSMLFRAKWPLGPTIPKKVKYRREERRRLRILYATIYERGNRLQKSTKFGLLKSLRKIYDVTEIDYIEPTSVFGAFLSGVDDLYYAAQAFQPDIFLLQAHDAVHMPLAIVRKLRLEFPGAIFISWNGDYVRRNLEDPNYQDLLRLMDFATFCAADYFPSYRKMGINCHYWQIGYEEYQELPITDSDKRYDVIFQGNEYSEKRTYLGHVLRAIPNTGIFGFWKSIKPDGSSYYDYSSQDKLYRLSKICISDQQYPQSIGYVSNRLLQAMRSGIFVLQQHIPEMEKYLKMRNGIHLVEWRDVEELPELISYWLSHDDERRKIADEGKRLVMREHNFDQRVSELQQLISGPR